jgi:hypothetical protein
MAPAEPRIAGRWPASAGPGRTRDVLSPFDGSTVARTGVYGVRTGVDDGPRHRPLPEHPDVIPTPHPMGITRPAMTLISADVVRGVADVLGGRPPTAVADHDWNHRKATA